MAFGNEAHIRIAKQGSMGVPVSATGSFFSVPFVSESLVVGIPQVVSDTIRGRYEEGPYVNGYIVPGGDITMRIHPDTIGLFLQGAFGQCSSTLATSAYVHTFKPVQTPYVTDLALPPLTIEKYAGVDEAHFYHDAQVARLTLEVAPGQYCRAAASLLCRTHSGATKSTPTFPEGNELIWTQASVTLGGTGNLIWENFTLAIDNNLTYAPALDGTNVFRRVVRNGFRTFRISGTADLPNNDEFDKYRAGSEQAVCLYIKGAAIGGSTEYLQIDIPNFRYETYPIAITGPNRVTVGFTGRAIYNQLSGHAVLVTLCNTRATY